MNIEDQLIEQFDLRNIAACENILAAMDIRQVELLYDTVRSVKSPRHRLYEVVRKEMIRRGRLVAYR